MSILLESLRRENSRRGIINRTFKSNKVINKAKALGYTISNSTQANIANGLSKLEEEFSSGSIVKKISLGTNNKLNGIPTISFPNIFIQSEFLRLYNRNKECMDQFKVTKILVKYFKENKVCLNCNLCNGLCYNNKFEAQYPSKVVSELRNLLAYILEPEALSKKIIMAAKRSKSKLFRINSNGEIHSQEMLYFWINIAKSCPDITFYTYTKSYELFNSYLENNFLPINLHVNMSLVAGNEMIVKKYPKLSMGNKFKIVTHIPEGSTTTCTGNCSTCGRLCMTDLPKDNNTIYCLYHN